MTSISIGEEDFTVGPVAVTQDVSSIAVAALRGRRLHAGRRTSPRRAARVSTSGLTPDRFGRLRGDLTIGFLDKPWIAVGPSPTTRPRTSSTSPTPTSRRVRGPLAGRVPDPGADRDRDVHRAGPVDRRRQDLERPGGREPDRHRELRRDRGRRRARRVDAQAHRCRARSRRSRPTARVYVAWVDSTDDEAMKGLGEIDIARSTDSGVTFGAPVTGVHLQRDRLPAAHRVLPLLGLRVPAARVGPRWRGLHRRTSARPPDNVARRRRRLPRVVDRRGPDLDARRRGSTTTTGSALQFFPSVAVDPDGGVHVMWGDMRDDPAQTRYSIYYTRSAGPGRDVGLRGQDPGHHHPATRGSRDFASNPNRGFPNGLFLGDYFSIRAAPTTTCTWSGPTPAWASTARPTRRSASRGAQAVPGTRGVPVAATGPGGQQVTLQGFGYQPDHGRLRPARRQHHRARPDRQERRLHVALYMPVTSEGDQTDDRRRRSRATRPAPRSSPSSASATCATRTTTWPSSWRRSAAAADAGRRRADAGRPRPSTRAMNDAPPLGSGRVWSAGLGARLGGGIGARPGSHRRRVGPAARRPGARGTGRIAGARRRGQPGPAADKLTFHSVFVDTAPLELQAGNIDLYLYGLRTEAAQQLQGTAGRPARSRRPRRRCRWSSTRRPRRRASSTRSPSPRSGPAMEYLVDRDFISQDIYRGLAQPMITHVAPVGPRLPDRLRHRPRLGHPLRPRLRHAADQRRHDRRRRAAGRRRLAVQRPAGAHQAHRARRGRAPPDRRPGRVPSSRTPASRSPMTYQPFAPAIQTVYSTDPAAFEWNVYTEGWSRGAAQRYDDTHHQRHERALDGQHARLARAGLLAVRGPGDGRRSARSCSGASSTSVDERDDIYRQMTQNGARWRRCASGSPACSTRFPATDAT